MAEELIKLYAARMQAKGFAFSEDTEWQKEFEERFPYEETDDQLRCIAGNQGGYGISTGPWTGFCAVMWDLAKRKWLIRAAFKCVMDSKQCAVLVPYHHSGLAALPDLSRADAGLSR